MADLKKKYLSQIDDSQVLVTSGSINKTLDQAIEDGDIGGAGVGDVDILQEISEFDTSQGLTIEPSGVNGETFRLTHDNIATNFAEVTLSVAEKFRGKQLFLQLDINSTAESGNFKVIITDETNLTTLLDSQISKNDLLVEKRTLPFSTVDSTASIKVRFEALPESGSPTSDFDDAIIQLALTEKREISVIEQKVNTYTVNVLNDGTISTDGSSPAAQWWDSITRTSTGTVVVDYTSLGLTNAPKLNITPRSTNLITHRIHSLSATQADIRIQITGGTLTDEDFSLSLTKQGADFEDLTRKVERELSTFHEVIQESPTVTETKNLQSNITSDGEITDLTYSDLVVGETYDVSGNMVGVVTNGSFLVDIENGANYITEIAIDTSGTGAKRETVGLSFSFVAQDTSLTFTGSGIGGSDTLEGNSDGSKTFVQLTKRSSLLKANTAPDSKIEIPTSELRFEQSSATGAGAENLTVQFNSLTKLRGDAFTIDNSNGTVITINRDGLIDFRASFRPTANQNFFLSKNASDPSSLPLSGEYLDAFWNPDGSGAVKSVSWSGSVKKGDVLRVGTDGGITAGDSRSNLTIHHQEQKISVAISNIEPQFEDADSMVRVLGGNGLGSTNTNIRRFSNVIDNLGSSISYQDDAALGGSFTILEDGFYVINFMDSSSSGSLNMGISLNSTQLSTDIAGINDEDVLSQTTSAFANAEGSTNWSGMLQKGNVVRAHTNTNADATIGANLAQFTIAKVGKPSIAEVDVTPFSDVNRTIREDIRMSGQAGRGSINTNIAYFNKITSSSLNKLLSFQNSSTEGFSITALQDCYINAEWWRDMDSVTNNANIIAWTLNSSELSTEPVALTNQESIISITHTHDDGANNAALFATTSASIRLKKGDVLRPHDRAQINDSGKAGLNLTAQADSRITMYAVAQTKNEFSARIDAAGNLISKSDDFIESIVKNGTGDYTVNFVPDFFETVPAISIQNITDDVNATTVTSVLNDSISSFDVSIRRDTGSGVTNTDQAFSVEVSRQGSDVKDLERAIVQLNDFPRVGRTIYQTSFFEFISTAVAGATLANFLQTSGGETSKFYHTENDQLIIDKECFISIDGYALENAGDNVSSFSIQKNGSNVGVAIDRDGSSASFASHTQRAQAGDIFTFQSHTGNDEARISVTAQGNELERIGTAQNSTTETKILSSDVTSNGDITELSFIDDLKIGNWYIVTGNAFLGSAGGATATMDFFDQAGGVGNPYFRVLNAGASSSSSQYGIAFMFQAKTTSLFAYGNSLGSGDDIRGDGTRRETYVQLTNLNAEFLANLPETASHIVIGEERDTGDTFNGKPVYEYWGEVQADIVSSGTIEIIDSGLNPIGINNHSGTAWRMQDVISATSTSQSIIDYDRSNGNINAVVTNWKIGAGTRYKMRYTKP